MISKSRGIRELLGRAESVESLKPKKLASSIPEESSWKFHLQLLRKNDDKEIDSPTDVDDYPFEGRITHVDNMIKPSVGSVLIRGEVSNPDY